ncbi:hypothetical protein D3C76_1484520 [compost metagenome]
MINEVGSSAYFKSWPASPIEENEPKTLSRPIWVRPLITECEATVVPSPISTPAEMTQKGPIRTCAPIIAPGAIRLLSAIRAEGEIITFPDGGAWLSISQASHRLIIKPDSGLIGGNRNAWAGSLPSGRGDKVCLRPA